MDTNDILSRGTVKVSAVQARYGISRSKCYELMTSGDLPFTRIGKDRLIPVKAIEDLLRRGLVGATAEGGAGATTT